MNLKEFKPKQNYANKLNEFCGIRVDIDKLNLDSAQRMLLSVNKQLKKQKVSESYHNLHRSKSWNTKLMLRKTLQEHIVTLKKNRKLNESEEGKAALILATKDIVDRVQKMVDEVSKTRNEDLPPLLDRIREEMGMETSDAYADVARPALDDLLEQAASVREIVGKASGILSGDLPPEDPNMMGDDIPVTDDVPIEVDDDFAASDAAVGGDEPIGRPDREEI